MKSMTHGFLASVVAGVFVGQLAVAQRSPAPAPAQTTKNVDVLKDIEKTLGFVPQFIRVASDGLDDPMQVVGVLVGRGVGGRVVLRAALGASRVVGDDRAVDEVPGQRPEAGRAHR